MEEKYIKKLGLAINCFEGTEHLNKIISEIREYLDYVIVVIQPYSYFGNKMYEEDENELERLCDAGLIDDIVSYSPKLNDDARNQETIKRNLSIDYLKSKGCSHVLVIDSDEFYLKEDFKNAMDYIEKERPISTYCQYINYFKDFNHYLIYPFESFVPFIQISSLHFTYNGYAPVASDPTRRTNILYNVGVKVLDYNLIKMHHFSWIRKNIRKKLENWSAKKHFSSELIEKCIHQFEKWKDGQPAIMMFNVPDNKVKIAKFKNPFIK